jgi:hypothetical protein
MNTDSPTLSASPLSAALCRAQVAVLAAQKTSTNDFHNYKYASAETIIVVGGDALNANGLTLSLTSASFEAFPDGATFGGAVGLLRSTFLLEHAHGASRVLTSDTPVCPEAGKTSGWSRPLDKALFGARTEALGYALRDLLLIPREDAPNVSGRTDAAEGAGAAPPAGRRRAAGAAAAAVAPAAAPVASATPVAGRRDISPDDFKDASAETIGAMLDAHRAAGFGPEAEKEFTARAVELLRTTTTPDAWGGIIAAAKLTNGDCAAQLRTVYGAARARVKASAGAVAA